MHDWEIKILYDTVAEYFKLQKENLHVQKDIAHSLKEIVHLLRKPHHGLVAQSLTVRIGDNPMGNTVLTLGQKAQFTAHLFSGPLGTGTEVIIMNPVTWVSADPSVITVDATGLGTIVGPSKLDASGAPIPTDITATTTSPDANGTLQTFSNPPGDATVTDVAPPAPVAQSMTVTVHPL